MLTSKQLQGYQQALRKRQEEMIRHLEQHFAMETSSTDAIGELSSYDNHPADMGTELFERSKDIALTEHAEKELEEINEALHAIHEGTYGICRVCSMDISPERLDAVPTTSTCMEHSEDKQTFSRTNPVEEELLHPDLNTAIGQEESNTAYDKEDAWQEVSRYGTSETASDFYGDRDNYDDMYPNADEAIGTVEEVEKYPSDSNPLWTGK